MSPQMTKHLYQNVIIIDQDIIVLWFKKKGLNSKQDYFIQDTWMWNHTQQFTVKYFSNLIFTGLFIDETHVSEAFAAFNEQSIQCKNPTHSSRFLLNAAGKWMNEPETWSNKNQRTTWCEPSSFISFFDLHFILNTQTTSNSKNSHHWSSQTLSFPTHYNIFQQKRNSFALFDTIFILYSLIQSFRSKQTIFF